MVPFSLPNAAARKILVSTTAKSLYAFINTAASTTIAFPYSLNSVLICPEDYGVRYTIDGTVPTATNGILIAVGEKCELTGIAVSQLQLIRAESNDSNCAVQLGWTNER